MERFWEGNPMPVWARLIPLAVEVLAAAGQSAAAAGAAGTAGTAAGTAAAGAAGGTAAGTAAGAAGGGGLGAIVANLAKDIGLSAILGALGMGGQQQQQQQPPQPPGPPPPQPPLPTPPGGPPQPAGGTGGPPGGPSTNPAADRAAARIREEILRTAQSAVSGAIAGFVAGGGGQHHYAQASGLGPAGQRFMATAGLDDLSPSALMSKAGGFGGSLSMLPGGSSVGGAAGWTAGKLIENLPGASIVSGFMDLAETAVDLARAAEAWGEELKGSQSHLKAFNGQIARAFAQSDVRDIQRNIASGEATAGSTAGLVEALDDFKDAIQPFKDVATNILNVVGTGVLRLATELANVAAALSPIVVAARAFAAWRGHDEKGMAAPFQEILTDWHKQFKWPPEPPAPPPGPPPNPPPGGRGRPNGRPIV